MDRLPSTSRAASSMLASCILIIAANFDVASSYTTCVGSREVQIATVNLGIFASF